MSLPYDIELIFKLPPKTIEELEEIAKGYHTDLMEKYPNTIDQSSKYATQSGTFSAAYSDLLIKYNTLKQYIQSLNL